ncbi:MAG TPA: Lpg1974 family pore-forming outer membrane protein [Gemmataceae bacterium]|nr:Lpg1974 family pore-forming outer membrane protein [Gemmataceae bacterium]
MRTACRLAVVVALGVAATAPAQDDAARRATVLPTTELPAVLDLTPPELLAPPECAPHVEAPAGGWYGSVEFLYLTPRVRDLDFAIVDPRDDLVPAGRVQSLNYRASPGVRAALAYRVPGLGWDVGFAYTYFTASDEFGAAAPAGGLLYPTLTRAGMTNEAQAAAAEVHLTLNVYDLTAGRTWDVDCACRLRVFGGLRFATVRQSLTAGYVGRDADCAFVESRSNYDGVGPLFGGEAALGVGGGFGLFGRASGALLTGTMRAPFTETNNAGGTVLADLPDRGALTVPVVSLGVGLTYECHGVFVRAGYEVTNWFGLFERPTFVDDVAEGKFVRRSGNLSLDGFFLQFGLAF